jgi:hypothetical protein
LGYFKTLSDRFPYAIDYRVVGSDEIQVWRVLDRHPERTAQALIID